MCHADGLSLFFLLKVDDPGSMKLSLVGNPIASGLCLNWICQCHWVLFKHWHISRLAGHSGSIFILYFKIFTRIFSLG